MNSKNKYRPFPTVKLDDRMWPSQTITKAPIWCSVDLRDGNQALPVPMTVGQKIEMFELLVRCGFKEIEVGFPASSPTEFEFVRRLIEEKRIPSDVTIQVLVQAREDLIVQTVKSLAGAKKAIIHLYNSTSPAHRRIVFGLEKPEIITLAMQGAKWIKKYSAKLHDTDVVLQYSPESFSATEVEFSLEICEAVMNVWKPTAERKIILNLPCTVEVATPNVYADQIEWFCRNMSSRESAIISLHTHNDRGTGVAGTELGLLAGADRVEGTLFGNGERTGNLDIVIVALNMFTQGIDPRLDFSNLDSIRSVYENCTKMLVHQRQPYSGELVFTAFSGSHQDAIRKGLRMKGRVWEVPYLIIDPEDIGRRYDEVIRVNGQSGKGGVAYLLEEECGIHLPKDMIREFGKLTGALIDSLGREVTSADLKKMLWEEYVEKIAPYRLKSFQSTSNNGRCQCSAIIGFGNDEIRIRGKGNGPIDAFIQALQNEGMADVCVCDQAEHALGKGADANAVAYVKIEFLDGDTYWGVGVDSNTLTASIKAIVSALNRN